MKFLGFILPPLVIFGWLIFGSSTLGNDFQQAHVTEALNLRSYLALGLEPMWAPHFSGGIPYYGLAMAQAFHLPGWFMSHLPGYFTGNALVLFALKGLLVLMFGHAVTYFSLRRITGLQPWVCYALSLLTIYNLSVLDAFRYGTALDAFVYAQCLILVLISYLKEPRPSLLIGLVGLSQLLMTSGYPPTLPFAVLAGLLVLSVFGERKNDWMRRALIAALACFAGILLAAPNWVGLFEWLQVNERRALHSDLAWANFRPLNPIGLISSFFRPWGAEVHAAFGGSSLLGLVLGTAVVMIFEKPKTRWPFLVVLALPFLYAVGTVSPVFVFFFNHVPLFSTIRVPGRIFVIFPLLLIAVSAKLFQQTPKSLNHTIRVSACINGFFLVLSLVYSLIYPGVGWFGHDRLEISAESLNSFWSPWSKGAWICLGLLSSVFFYRAKLDSKKVWGSLIVLMLCQSVLMLQNGTWIESRLPSLSLDEFRSRTHLPLYRVEGMLATNSLAESSAGAATVPYSRFIKSAGRAANCYLPIDPSVTSTEKQAVLIPFYLSNRIRCLGSDSEIFEHLKSESCDEAHTLQTWVNAAGTDPACHANARESLATLNRGNHILALTPNLLEIQTSSLQESVLVTSFPNVNKNWSVKVDGQPASLLEVNGAFVGMRVPAGEHRLEVEYFSERLLMAYRLAMMALLIVSASVIVRRKRLGLSLIFLMALGGSSLLYFHWESSFVARAHAKVLLPNNYSELLSMQLERWQNHK